MPAPTPIFDWKVLDKDDPAKFAAVRAAAINLWNVVVDNCPDSPDRTTALYKVREAWFFANEAIQGKG